MKCRCKLPGNHIPGDGPENARVMFIGEAPGAREDEQGKPFVGRAGKMLTSCIESIEIKRRDVYITNIVKHRPPNNRKPKKEEINVCKKELEKEMRRIGPEIICLLGNTAIEAIIGKYPITTHHGKIIKKGRNFLLTFHPAAILRNPNRKSLFINDLRKLKKFM